MVKRALFAVVVFISILFFMSGCEQINKVLTKKTPAKKNDIPEVHGTVIAKVNNMVITLEELNRYVDTYNQQIDDFKEMYPDQEVPLEKVITAEQKVALLNDDLIRQRLLYQEALDRGIDKKEDVSTALKEFKMSLLIANLIQEETDKINITSEDIKKYYEDNKDFLREPEERRVREIMTKKESDANAALIEVLQGGDFGSVAQRYSIAKSASSGGDLGFIGPGVKGPNFPQFDIAIYSLEIGKVSSVVKNPDAEEYYILKVEGKKGGKEKPLSELWDDIKLALEQKEQKDSIDALIGKLRPEAKIDIETAKIK
ncbi:MAG: hypothetical protein COV72_05675 [Candidatus Omnitrophica bacterium CG11_big_fil_rev_8_21_14_0_20_42_13]|uniref:PpiC domain-containing protein n=1 Tax=Candidatus Ghiorseimicrobium undicola TaxID=1974746 RepID=A0A2H0LX43_9BACT|nr:MAG: hypothetical protein COV72_05675 [Candidatus Omnitrophica bacterium CG11_big_fil_rev_8_21_14_0_20_42_13]